MDQFTPRNEAEMLALGARLGRVLEAGDTVALIGDLGAGKTTLARGLVQAVLPQEVVPSPTYTLVQAYDLPEFTLLHCDLYRLEHPDEAYEIGLIDAMGEDVCLIEWPDRLGPHLPQDAMIIDIKFEGDGRVVSLRGWGNRNV
jgi:tRNA threonylcarbamoyladenosine biosynthesis protein TsaE